MVESEQAKVDQLVILVHGIRDIRRWQSEVRITLEGAGFIVEPTNYDRMNLIEFLFPVPIFRNIAIKKVLTQIRKAIELHPMAQVSIIAHSFGTYVVSRILSEAFDLKFHKIIFCGSVVRYDFEFEKLSGRFISPIINDVGTGDPWPAVAESLTFGYGSAGTYGFMVPGVRDRFHNGAGHGYFLSATFCKNNWIPVLEHRINIPLGDSPHALPPMWVRALSIFKIRYFLCSLILLLMLWGTAVTIWPAKSYFYDFNVSDSPYTYWNQPVRELLRDVNEPCGAIGIICRFDWLRGITVKRDYVPVKTVDNEITRIVSCKPFSHPPKASSNLIEHDPIKALFRLADAFPSCIWVRMNSFTTIHVGLQRHQLVERKGPSGDTVLLCDCTVDQVASFQ